MATHPPARAPGRRDPEAEDEFALLTEVVTALRAYRSAQDVPSRTELEVSLQADRPVALSGRALAALARASLREDPAPGARVVGVGFGRLLVHDPSADPDADRRRIEAAIAEAQNELARARRQLANERFTERAPEHLVEAEREKERRYAAELEALRAELEGLGER